MPVISHRYRLAVSSTSWQPCSSVGLGVQGMNAGKAGQGRHFLVDPGIVLHGAGAQGIEAVSSRRGPAGTARCSDGQCGLARSAPAGTVPPSGAGPPAAGHRVYVAGRQYGAATAGYAFLKNQLHLGQHLLHDGHGLSSASSETISVAHHEDAALHRQAAQDAGLRQGRQDLLVRLWAGR